jgi:hypothetical protein
MLVEDLDPIRTGHLCNSNLSWLTRVFRQWFARSQPRSAIETKNPLLDEAPEPIWRILPLSPLMKNVEVPYRHYAERCRSAISSLLRLSILMNSGSFRRRSAACSVASYQLATSLSTPS